MPQKLTLKQYKAAKMVAEGEMPAIIESTLNMRRHTLTRWRRLKPFQDAVNQHVRDMEMALPLRMRHMHYLSTNQLFEDIRRWGSPKTDEVTKTVKAVDMAKKLLEMLPETMFDEADECMDGVDELINDDLEL